MTGAPVPTDEPARLAALRRLSVLDTPPEERFDRLVRLACSVMDVPIAMINLVDADRQWSKASFGVGVRQSPREQSFCAFTLLSPEPVIVTDALADERFRDHEQVLAQPWLRFYAGVPLQEPGGHTVGAFCIADRVPRDLRPEHLGPLRDLAAITENELAQVDLVRALTARRAADERSAAIIAATGNGLVTLDERGMIVDVNPATQQMFGYAVEELIGESAQVLLLPGGTERMAELFRTTLAQAPRPDVRDTMLRRRDGTSFPVHLTTTTFVDDGRRLFVVAVEDDTERHRMRQETSAALAAQQTANVELDRVNRLKSEFVSMVSHEFRTALTGVRAFSELIRDRDLPMAEIKEFAGDINADSERLTQMITDLLDLERMEAGEITLHPALLDLDGVVSDVANRFRYNDSGHQIVVRTGGTGSVTADKDKLGQALSNLISNAIKYSPERTSVTVWTWLDGATAHIAVVDQGPGLPAPELERVFDRYARVEHTQTRQIGGTGLGLPIVRQIMHLHGGHAWVESKVGEGAQFHLTLPVTPPEQPAVSTDEWGR